MISYSQQLSVIVVLLIALLIYYVYDYYAYKKILARLKLRIHVNGTRGKSSTTRLIAGGLRAHGLIVCAKTTGSAAKFIEPDGQEQPIRRLAPANIKEVGSFIKKAVGKYQADTVVVECMAVTPEYQEALESRFIKADILVLTNIRTDHEDIMGRGKESIARALARTLPENGTVITNRESYELLMKIGIITQNIVLSDSYELSEKELANFPYEVIKENVQLALAVCMYSGINRKTALQGMWNSLPDVGNLSRSYWQAAAGPIQIINALAANDPESTLMLWHKYIDADNQRVLLTVNCRADRKERTRDILNSFAKLHQGMFLLCGDIDFAENTLKQLGVSTERIISIKHLNKSVLMDLEPVKSGQIDSVFAAGNIKGCEFLSSEVV